MTDQKTQGKSTLKKEKIRRIFHNIAEDIRDIFDERRSYIQMRLPVENITEEFEKSLTDKIEHSIVHAEIRVASEKDIEHIMKIYDNAWHTTSMPIRNVTSDTFSKLYKEQDTIFLIARVDSTDAGFILLDFEGENKNIGVIGGLGIIKSYQHKGLGTILGMAAWKYFKKNHSNVQELRCEVYKENTISYNFIKGLGFEEFHPMDSAAFLMK
jgi:ribosomal protein S18 acetylase RimI-like enzyme